MNILLRAHCDTSKQHLDKKVWSWEGLESRCSNSMGYAAVALGPFRHVQNAECERLKA